MKKLMTTMALMAGLSLALGSIVPAFAGDEKPASGEKKKDKDKSGKKKYEKPGEGTKKK